MIEYSPTRINLLLLKKRLEWARSGVDLLKGKREALMKEFFGLVHGVTSLRERLDDATTVSAKKLIMAKAFVGEEALFSASLSTKRDVHFDIKIENVWGINIPDIEEGDLKRAIDEKGFSPIGENLWTISVSDAFEDVLNLVIKVASQETRLKRVGEEIKATTRRINALEDLLIPSIRGAIKRIEGVFEESEREEVWRLKRFKRKKRRRFL